MKALPRFPLWCLVWAVLLPAARGEEDYYDIGSIAYPVSTDSATAQRWFDRGLAMCLAFNHEEAVRCFENAAVADPGLAMAYWGMAYAWGPNINNMEIDSHQLAQADLAMRLAKLHAQDVSATETILIDALAQRYATPAPEDRDPLNRAYAEAMRQAYAQHADDVLITVLLAESLMNLQPWAHFSREGEAEAHTAEIVRVLETGLRRWPQHPGLCHLYIHLMEASPHPEKALDAANALRASTGLGHLLHMPSHIDIWLGRYHEAILANQRAIEADKAYLRERGSLNFYSLYRIHNYHFLVYTAMFDGQRAVALEAAQAIPQQVPEPMLREQVDFLDAFMPTELHVYVRFGDWERILEHPEPAEYLPMSRSIWRYARAIAYAATERVDLARREQKAFMQQRELVPESSFLFQNASRDILDVAEAMMAGEIAYRQGTHQRAFEHLRQAIQRDDALHYDEPWGWMQPTRHALGALLLEQGKFNEAQAVYEADLKLHPHNPWALHGLAEALENQGQAKAAEQRRAEFLRASQRADVSIDRSCYCRLAAE